MNKSENLNELALALSHAQFEIEGAVKGSKNPFFKSSYANLESVWAAVQEPLSNNGLSIAQILDESESGMVLETMLLHKSGQFISGRCRIVSLKQDPQAIGSAITYFRRYALSSILSVPAIDDDGNHASNKTITEAKDLKELVSGEPSFETNLPPESKAQLSQIRKPAATMTQAGTKCNHNWKLSQYKANEEYCSICKEKRRA